MAEIDKSILQEYTWDAYSFTPALFKPQVEGCLLTQVIIRSNNTGIDNAYSQWDKCTQLLAADDKFRKILLDCWKLGSFDRVRDHKAIQAPQDDSDTKQSTTVIHNGSTFTEVHGDSYTINYETNWKSDWIMKWLCEVDYGAMQRVTYSKRSEGTGDWFLQSLALETWITSTEKRILWCTGMPGVGKTVLASLTVQYLEHLRHGPVCFVYLNYKRRATQSLSHIFAAILRQLYERYDPAYGRIKAFWKAHAVHIEPSLSDMKKEGHSIAETAKSIYLVLDGLDEYLEHYSDESIVHLRDALMSIPNLKVMVTSRIIGGMKKIFSVNHVVHQEIYTSDNDMRTYLKGRISTEVSGRFREEFRDQVLENITKVAKQRFLLAKLYMDLITTRLTAGELRDTLASLSEEVDHVYRQAVDRINEQAERQRELAFKILLWVTCTHRALKIKELQHALAAAPNRNDVLNYIYPEELLTSVCAGLIIVNETEGVVQFVHHTAQEFFESARDEYFRDADLTISTTCAHYLTIEPYMYDGEVSRVFTLLDNLPLFRYMSEHLGKHLKSCSADPIALLGGSMTPGAGVLLAICCAEGHFPLYDWRRLRWQDVHLAAAMDLVPILKNIITERPDWNTRERATGFTPLACALRTGAINVIRYLLDHHGINANECDSHGDTLLAFAIRYGRKSVADILLESKGININSKSNIGRTPLHFAVIYDRMDMFMKLISSPSVDVNPEDKKGETPLFHAVRYRQEEMAKILLQDPRVIYNSVNSDGRTPLAIAIAEDVLPMVKILLQRDSFTAEFRDNRGRTYLSWASEQGMLEIVLAILAVPGCPVDSPDKYGRTPLSYAASDGHTEVVNVLLRTSVVNPNTKDWEGCTPLYNACNRQCRKVVEVLVEAGSIDVDLANDKGRTPLSIAAEHGNTPIVEHLLRAGANPNTQDVDGRTPLAHAAHSYHTSVVKLLLSRGASVDTRDNQGCTPLGYATFLLSQDNNNVETMKALLLAGADINAQDNDGRTALIRAVCYHSDEAVKFLIHQGANVDIGDNYGRPAISHAAAWYHSDRMLKVLLRHTQEVNPLDQGGQTPLMIASSSGSKDSVRTLIAAGANVDARDSCGRTALSYAVAHTEDSESEYYGPRGVAKILLEANASVNLADNEGRTPLDYASIAPTIELLRKFGAAHGDGYSDEGLAEASG